MKHLIIRRREEEEEEAGGVGEAGEQRIRRIRWKKRKDFYHFVSYSANKQINCQENMSLVIAEN